MNPISIKQTIRLKLDRLFHIDRKGEYGLMANNAYLSPDCLSLEKVDSQSQYLCGNTIVRNETSIMMR